MRTDNGLLNSESAETAAQEKDKNLQTVVAAPAPTEASDISQKDINRYLKSKTVHIALMFFTTVVASVGITMFVFLNYFYRPVVVMDLKEVVTYMQTKSKTMEKDDAIKMIGSYFDDMSKSLQSRKEIVLVKEAVLNAEQFKDITPEYKK
jgi:hypothetical protein